MHRHKRRSAVLSTLSVITLVTVAAACGGDDDDAEDGPDGTEAVAGTDAAEPGTTDAETDTTGSPDEGSAEPGDHGGRRAGDDGDAPRSEPGPGENHQTDEGEPVQGGTLVYGIEADSASPWAPYKTQFATAGLVPITAISDSLFGISDAGEVLPLLVESYETNDDYTEWTLHIREGITFHDGTPLDGAAVKFNLDANKAGPITASAMVPVDTVTASGQDVVITTKGGRGSPCRPCSRTGDGVHDVADVVGEPARRAAAHRGWSRLRRRGRGDAGRRRSGEAGGPRGVRVRVVHAGQRQLVPGRAQRGLLARPQRDHR